MIPPNFLDNFFVSWESFAILSGKLFSLEATENTENYYFLSNKFALEESEDLSDIENEYIEDNRDKVSIDNIGILLGWGIDSLKVLPLGDKCLFIGGTKYGYGTSPYLYNNIASFHDKILDNMHLIKHRDMDIKQSFISDEKTIYLDQNIISYCMKNKSLKKKLIQLF